MRLSNIINGVLSYWVSRVV